MQLSIIVEKQYTKKSQARIDTAKLVSVCLFVTIYIVDGAKINKFNLNPERKSLMLVYSRGILEKYARLDLILKPINNKFMIKFIKKNWRGQVINQLHTSQKPTQMEVLLYNIPNFPAIKEGKYYNGTTFWGIQKFYTYHIEYNPSKGFRVKVANYGQSCGPDFYTFSDTDEYISEDVVLKEFKVPNIHLNLFLNKISKS